MDSLLHNKIKISICIPTYEAEGRGVMLLEKLVNSILIQKYSNYEIIISDQSIDDNIKNYIDTLNINNLKYYKYLDNIGSPTFNTNNAIEQSSGDYIKIMFMDDYFDDDSVISKMVSKLSKSNWVVCGFKHKKIDNDNIYRFMFPNIDGDGKHLLYGINYIGCPSVALIPKNIFFDTSVKYMFDCELWYRLLVEYGMPEIIYENLIVITVGEHSLTHQLRLKYDDMLKEDIKYCEKKFQIN